VRYTSTHIVQIYITILNKNEFQFHIYNYKLKTYLTYFKLQNYCIFAYSSNIIKKNYYFLFKKIIQTSGLICLIYLLLTNLAEQEKKKKTY